jgi:hypothetical protein
VRSRNGFGGEAGWAARKARQAVASNRQTKSNKISRCSNNAIYCRISKKQRGELQRLSPYLQAEDWVIVTIDSSPLPPPPLLQAGVLGGANPQQQNILGNLPPGLAANQGALSQQSLLAGAQQNGSAAQPELRPTTRRT